MPIIGDRDGASDKAIQSMYELQGAMKSVVDEAIKYHNQLEKIDAAFRQSKGISGNKKATEELTLAEKELLKVSQAIEKEKARQNKAYIEEKKALDSLRDATKKKVNADKEAAKEQQKLAKEQAKQAQELKKTTVEYQKEIQAKNQSIKAARDEAKAILNGTQALDRLNKKRLEAQNRLKNLIAAQELSGKVTKQGNAEIRKAKAEFDRLDKSYVKVQRSARQFNDNVGNYPKNLSSATNALKGFASAFGLVSGVAVFANVLRDAANRVRAFDKEITNMAAVAGKTRPQVEDLEKEIIAVSGSSVNTANEVAALATELIKLGSTAEEAEKLLKPVNDFSIALRASAEESAAFLKGVLNAFGVGAEEAGRFADVLANAANRSALDFQGLNESFGYVAPTARQLGIPIERLAAQIGTLADNNIAASRAGRLLNTSFARLVTKGLTLEQALEKIRRSTDKVKTATELFGAESFGIGLILAENEEKVNDLTKEFENSKGSLEELTNKQLASLDAQLKILDSTWEQFILGLENGNGVLAETTSRIVELAGGLLQTGINLEKITDSKYLSFFDKAGASVKTWASYIPLVRVAFGDLNENVVKDLENIDKALDKTLDGVDQDFQFGFAGLEGDEAQSQIDNIIFFRDRLRENLQDIGFSFDESNRIAGIWAKNTAIEFSNVAKGVKSSGAGKAIDDFKEDAKQSFEEFKKELDELINATDEFGKKFLDSLSQKRIREVREANEELGRALFSIFTTGSADETQEQVNKFYENILSEQRSAVSKAIEGINDQNEAEKDALEETDKKYRLSYEKRREIQERFEEFAIDSINNIANSYFESQQRQLEAALSRNQAQEEIQITSLENTLERDDISEEARERTEKRIIEIKEQSAKREAEIKTRQARLEKQQSLVQIAINTATSIAKTAATVGYPAAFPLIAIAAATGAVQAALVAAQPIPQYWTGSEDTADTFIAGDKGPNGKGGPELLVNKGKAQLVDKPTLFSGMPHSKVFNTEDTIKILNNHLLGQLRINDRQPIGKDASVDEIKKGFKSLERTIKSKPAHIINGQIVGAKVNGTRISKINKVRGI